MNGLLVAFLIVLLVPLFVATWRSSLAGLALQGALMSSMAFRHGAHLSVASVTEFVDLVVLRTFAAPVLLYLVLKRQNAPRRNDVIAPNLFSWAIALALVLVAFRLADILVPSEGDLRTLVAVAGSAVVLGLLVLSTRAGPFSQMVGALRLENGIALFELGLGPEHDGIGIRIAQTVIFGCSIAFFRYYLANAPDFDGAEPGVEKEAL